MALTAFKNMWRSRHPTESVFQQNPESESRKNCRVVFWNDKKYFFMFPQVNNQHEDALFTFISTSFGLIFHQITSLLQSYSPMKFGGSRLFPQSLKTPKAVITWFIFGLWTWVMAHFTTFYEFYPLITILSLLDTGKVVMSSNIFPNFPFLVPNFLHLPKIWNMLGMRHKGFYELWPVQLHFFYKNNTIRTRGWYLVDN